MNSTINSKQASEAVSKWQQYADDFHATTDKRQRQQEQIQQTIRAKRDFNAAA